MAKRTSQEQQYDTQQVQKGGIGIRAAGDTAGAIGTERSTLLPAYQSIIAKPGYDDPTKSAMRLNTLGGLGSRFGAAADTLSNRVARTRNPAGYVEGLGEMAREQGRQVADTTAGLESKFADVALSERDKALEGMSKMFGVDQDTLTRLVSQQAPTRPQGGFGIKAGIPGVAEVGYQT